MVHKQVQNIKALLKKKITVLLTELRNAIVRHN